MTDVKYPKVKVDMTTIDGNAFSIMGHTAKALRRGGVDEAEVKEYLAEAQSGDYNHLVATTFAWVTTDLFDEDEDDQEDWDY